MSQQRVCDLDGTLIDPEVDVFYVVTDGRSGRTKDICLFCSQGPNGITTWTADTAFDVGMRVGSTAGYQALGWEYIVTVAGVTGATEPTWPTSPITVTDGTVIYKARPEPDLAAIVHEDKVGQPDYWYTLDGWMSGSHELS